MRVGHSDKKNCSGKEWKSFEIISECSFNPSSKAGEWSTTLFPRASSPPIAALPALEVRHHDDMHDPEDNACSEQREFDGHSQPFY